MTWKDSFSIGIPEIDKQHRQLCDKIDELYDACSRGQGAEEVLKVLNFLEAYTVRHFADEEKVQLRINYPKYKEHKAMHTDFISRLTKMKKEMTASGVTTPVVININHFISDWLIKHIIGVDMELKKYMS